MTGTNPKVSSSNRRNVVLASPEVPTPPHLPPANRDPSGEAEGGAGQLPPARTPPSSPRGRESPQLRTNNETHTPPQHVQLPQSPPILHPPTTQGPVGGRLQQFWRQWRDRGAHPWVVGVLRWGYVIKFSTVPTTVRFPTVESGYKDPTMNSHLLDAVQKLIAKDAIEEVYTRESAGYYSRLFLTPKATGGWRPIIDLKPLNPSIVGSKIKQETQAQIRSSLLPNQWAISIDLSDAFFHIPIHPSSRRFLRFSIHGRIFQYKALPFGVSCFQHIPAPFEHCLTKHLEYLILSVFS